MYDKGLSHDSLHCWLPFIWWRGLLFYNPERTETIYSQTQQRRQRHDFHEHQGRCRHHRHHRPFRFHFAPRKFFLGESTEHLSWKIELWNSEPQLTTGPQWHRTAPTHGKNWLNCIANRNAMNLLVTEGKNSPIIKCTPCNKNIQNRAQCLANKAVIFVLCSLSFLFKNYF